MRVSWLLAFIALGVLLTGCSSVGFVRKESTYSLNGKQVVMKGDQDFKSPKGNEVTIEGPSLRVNVNGEEEITINGMRLRAYGDKIEVDGKAYPVSAGEVLELGKEQIVIRKAETGGKKKKDEE